MRSKVSIHIFFVHFSRRSMLYLLRHSIVFAILPPVYFSSFLHFSCSSSWNEMWKYCYRLKARLIRMRLPLQYIGMNSFQRDISPIHTDYDCIEYVQLESLCILCRRTLFVRQFESQVSVVIERWPDSTTRGRGQVPMGVSVDPLAESGLLSALHQVDWPEKRNLQTARLQGRFTAMGSAEEQAWYELRDDGQSIEVSVPTVNEPLVWSMYLLTTSLPRRVSTLSVRLQRISILKVYIIQLYSPPGQHYACNVIHPGPYISTWTS